MVRRTPRSVTAALVHVGSLLPGAWLDTGLAATPGTPDGVTPLEWSVRMADSEIARLDDTLVWQEGGRAKWTYTTGLLTLSLLKLHEQVPHPAYVAFSEEAIGSFIADDGTIRKYKRSDFNIDHINSGKSALYLERLTGEARYGMAVDALRDQLKDHPRTREGGFWHKERYPDQMWLDGLYMGAPFYAEYAVQHDQLKDLDNVIEDADVTLMDCTVNRNEELEPRPFQL